MKIRLQVSTWALFTQPDNVDKLLHWGDYKSRALAISEGVRLERDYGWPCEVRQYADGGHETINERKSDE